MPTQKYVTEDKDDHCREPCAALHKTRRVAGTVQSQGNGRKRQSLYQRELGSGAGKLGCDVDRPIDYGCRCCSIGQLELNLETEGSLLLSSSSPLLCILQSAAVHYCKSMLHALCS